MVIGDPVPLGTALDLNREQLPTAINNHAAITNLSACQVMAARGESLLQVQCIPFNMFLPVCIHLWYVRPV